LLPNDRHSTMRRVSSKPPPSTNSPPAPPQSTSSKKISAPAQKTGKRKNSSKELEVEKPTTKGGKARKSQANVVSDGEASPSEGASSSSSSSSSESEANPEPVAKVVKSKKPKKDPIQARLDEEKVTLSHAAYHYHLPAAAALYRTFTWFSPLLIVLLSSYDRSVFLLGRLWCGSA
jgi:hypothetical protein